MVLVPAGSKRILIMTVQTTFTGDLVEDPKLRCTNNGHSVSSLRLESTEREASQGNGGVDR